MSKLISSLLLMVFLTSSAHASFISKFTNLEHHAKTMPKALGNTQQYTTSFTDFSGHWQGECLMNADDDNESVPLDFTIEQSDEYTLSIRDHDGVYRYQIGAVESRSRAHQLYEFAFETVNWSADKTQLIFNNRSIAAISGRPELYTYLTKMTLSLQNNQLDIAIASRYFNDLTPYFDIELNTCTLSKVN